MYRPNAIIGEIHRRKLIASKFDKEIWRIRERYWNAGLRSNFVNETIHNLKKETEETVIHEWLFEEKKCLLWDFHNYL